MENIVRINLHKSHVSEYHQAQLGIYIDIPTKLL